MYSRREGYIKRNENENRSEQDFFGVGKEGKTVVVERCAVMRGRCGVDGRKESINGKEEGKRDLWYTERTARQKKKREIQHVR